MKSEKVRGYVVRGLEGVLVEAMGQARVVAVLGARQAGKSTLARRMADHGLISDYVSLDDEPALSLATSDPVGFVGGLDRPVVIDEIQRVPALLLAIKSQVDRDNSPGQFLITGSANLLSLPTVADALPGRVDYLTLWPFTQGEIEGRRETFLDILFSGDSPSWDGAPVGRKAYGDRLLAGGYPESQHRAGAGRTRFFESYAASIVDRDVRETARVEDPAALMTLIRLVAARSGSIARYEKLGREVGIDGKTVKRYFEILERLYLVRVRRPWYVNLGKRQTKAPKLYIADTGLLSALVGIDANRLADDDGIAGALFETFIATELERQASWAPGTHTFWHYRDETSEVDVVVERPSGEIIGVEVKSGATVRPRDFRGLTYLRDQTGDRFKAGVVLHSGARTVPFGDRLWAVPHEAVWAI